VVHAVSANINIALALTIAVLAQMPFVVCSWQHIYAWFLYCIVSTLSVLYLPS
jgi:hypothetical protein